MENSTKKRLKKTSLVFLIFTLFFYSVTLMSCNSFRNAITGEYKNYKSQQSVWESYDEFACIEFIESYLAGKSGYANALIQQKKRKDWGNIRLISVTHAVMDAYVNGYRYNRVVRDPREIYYVWKYINSLPRVVYRDSRGPIKRTDNFPF
ncbi:MAG: hypothetical protein FWC03_09350 [Treponema sp.]|nr:hypothetical protein [Treponema sp.]